MPRLAANFSLMFQEVDMLDRFGIAARIGFTGAEIQNPYEQTSEDIAEAYKKNGLEAVLFNTSSFSSNRSTRETCPDTSYTTQPRHAESSTS